MISKAIIYGLGLALMAALAALGTQTWRLHSSMTAIAGLKQAAAEQQAAQYQYTTEWLNDAVQGFTKADDNYQRGMADAKQNSQRLVADLNNDNVRLRDYWQGCKADLHATNDTASAKLDSERRRLREASAGRIVGIVAECQARFEYVRTRYNALVGE